MPTPYQQMVSVAEQGWKNRTNRHQAVMDFISRLLTDFRDYCDMPTDRLKLLPWVEEKQTFEGRLDTVYPLWQVVHYDEKKDEWRACICIILGRPDSFPQMRATAGLFVTEKESQFVVHFADLNTETLDLDDPTQSDAFFASIVKNVNESFAPNRNKQRGGVYGFRVENQS